MSPGSAVFFVAFAICSIISDQTKFYLGCHGFYILTVYLQGIAGCFHQNQQFNLNPVAAMSPSPVPPHSGAKKCRTAQQDQLLGLGMPVITCRIMTMHSTRSTHHEQNMPKYQGKVSNVIKQLGPLPGESKWDHIQWQVQASRILESPPPKLLVCLMTPSSMAGGGTDDF